MRRSRAALLSASAASSIAFGSSNAAMASPTAAMSSSPVDEGEASAARSSPPLARHLAAAAARAVSAKPATTATPGPAPERTPAGRGVGSNIWPGRGGLESRRSRSRGSKRSRSCRGSSAPFGDRGTTTGLAGECGENTPNPLRGLRTAAAAGPGTSGFPPPGFGEHEPGPLPLRPSLRGGERSWPRGERASMTDAPAAADGFGGGRRCGRATAAGLRGGPPPARKRDSRAAGARGRGLLGAPVLVVTLLVADAPSG